MPVKESEPAESRLLNKREAARFLGVCVGTVERMMRSGLPSVKLSTAGAVRFRHSDLCDFVDRRVRGFPDGGVAA